MQKKTKTFEWTVVGAGPAGIAALGKLLDAGVKPADILWIDPTFTVGDLGALWRHVSSNTTVALFLRFLHACASFQYKEAPSFPIHSLPEEDTCALEFVVEPLQWITQTLQKTVIHEKTLVKSICLERGTWTITSDIGNFLSKKIILTTGAVPATLHYPGTHVLPFEEAIDPTRLQSHFHPKHQYAVFGSSHSAILILRNLIELGAKKIVNFYRSPCTYAVNMGDWILFDNTGLKGKAARFAREHIDGVLPPNLSRHSSSEENITRYLPQCDTVIYAVGFKLRQNIMINENAKAAYNPRVGIIGPGLFGLGIGYPELKADPFGFEEYQVGLWKFMVYLDKVLPVWFLYHA
jgi:hypothetical protein